MSTEQTSTPTLRVVSGKATPEEIAVLVAVLTAASAGGNGGAAPSPRRSLWSDASRVPGSRVAPGPGAWRASGLPH
ncbi:acyl-CoA carboxylase subunit epsilon [Ornithinimicrobium cavernae]|uniref:acyl-CoA carboxylase subunit epsilon n=1 Tax=Ornithinimicrobium cavernae TaxID=2666047 RepID=UPI000D697ABB|nr:acyl-CoA carboxylase subunit epsilon [Ornithinimicrobium cavernae]